MPTNEEKHTLIEASQENEDTVSNNADNNADKQPESSNALYTLPPHIQRMVNLYSTGQYTITKLAELLNVHPNTIGGWLKREDVKEAMLDAQTTMHDQVSTQLKALTLKATRKLNELVDSPIDAVALQAVKDVLDRSGHKAKQEIKVDKTVTTIEQKMKELIESTISIDGDYEEVD